MMKMTQNKTALQDYIHENEHLKTCLKADTEIQNRIIKLAEPFMNIQNGRTYSAYHALDTVEKIVKSYADLPEKIESLVRYEVLKGYDEKALVYLDDILNLLKEGV